MRTFYKRAQAANLSLSRDPRASGYNWKLRARRAVIPESSLKNLADTPRNGRAIG
jgi:hypothetical protein